MVARSMDEQQAHDLVRLAQLQFGVTIGIFTGILVLIVFVGSRRR